MNNDVFDRIKPEFDKAAEFWSLVYAYPNDIVNEALTAKDDTTFNPADDSDFGYTNDAEQFMERAEKRKEAYEEAHSTFDEFFELFRDLNRYLQAKTEHEKETINNESEWALDEHKEAMDSLLERDIELVFSSSQMFVTEMLHIKNTRSNPSALFTGAMNNIEQNVFDGENVGRMNYAQPNTKAEFVQDDQGQYCAIMEPVDDATARPIVRDDDEANHSPLRHKPGIEDEALSLNDLHDRLEDRTRTVTNTITNNVERFNAVSA